MEKKIFLKTFFFHKMVRKQELMKLLINEFSEKLKLKQILKEQLL